MGNIYTKFLSADELKQLLKSDEGLRGVFGYYTKNVVEVSQLTTGVNSNGQPFACNPVEIRKVVPVTDYEHPFQVYYKAGWFDTNSFGVQMNNKVFTSINSQSTPDQGKTLGALAGAAAALMAAAAIVPPQQVVGQPSCNAGQTFTRYDRLGPFP